jgi:hypothetical protein
VVTPRAVDEEVVVGRQLEAALARGLAAALHVHGHHLHAVGGLTDRGPEVLVQLGVGVGAADLHQHTLGRGLGGHGGRGRRRHGALPRGAPHQLGHHHRQLGQARGAVAGQLGQLPHGHRAAIFGVEQLDQATLAEGLQIEAQRQALQRVAVLEQLLGDTRLEAIELGGEILRERGADGGSGDQRDQRGSPTGT